MDFFVGYLGFSRTVLAPTSFLHLKKVAKLSLVEKETTMFGIPLNSENTKFVDFFATMFEPVLFSPTFPTRVGVCPDDGSRWEVNCHDNDKK